MKNPFLQESAFRADDLLKWAEILEAVGYVMSALSDSKDNEVLDWYGDKIGMIIQDYAGAIHQTVEECHKAVQDFYDKQSGACLV